MVASAQQFSRTTTITSATASQRYTVIAQPVQLTINNPTGSQVTLFYGYTSTNLNQQISVAAGTVGSLTINNLSGSALTTQVSSTNAERMQVPEWSGLTAGNSPLSVNAPPATFTVFFKWGSAGQVFSQFFQSPVAELDVSLETVGTGTFKNFAHSPYEGTLTAGVNQYDGEAAPGEEAFESPWLNFEGDNLKFPLYSAEAGTVIIEVDGQTYSFPVVPGLSYVDVPIPANWSGTLKQNGQTMLLGGNIAWDGQGFPSAGMVQPSSKTGYAELIANPYSALPAGMTRWTGQVDIPAGMKTASGSDWIVPPGFIGPGVGLPPGHSSPGAATLPPGVSIQTPDYQGGKIVTKTTTAAGSTSSVTDTAKSTTGTSGTNVTNNTVNNNTTINNIIGGSSTDLGDGGTAAMNGIATDGDIGLGENTGDLGPGLKNSTGSAREGVVDKFAALRLLSSEGIPRTNVYHLSMDMGSFGSINREIDFTEAPWPALRAAALIMMTFGFGVSFLKRCTI